MIEQCDKDAAKAYAQIFKPGVVQNLGVLAAAFADHRLATIAECAGVARASLAFDTGEAIARRIEALGERT